jgi:hypothetical protein
LKDVESQIQDKEDAIAITRMSILRYQERIDKILSGLDQVQSSRGKIPLPSKDEFLSYAQTTDHNNFMVCALKQEISPFVRSIMEASRIQSAFTKYAGSSFNTRLASVVIFISRSMIHVNIFSLTKVRVTKGQFLVENLPWQMSIDIAHFVVN